MKKLQRWQTFHVNITMIDVLASEVTCRLKLLKDVLIARKLTLEQQLVRQSFIIFPKFLII